MKFFKNSKQKVNVKEVEPRALDEITKEYNNLCAQAGAIQYQIYVYRKELEQVNQALIRVNGEAAKRNKLDQEAKAEVKEEKVES